MTYQISTTVLLALGATLVAAGCSRRTQGGDPPVSQPAGLIAYHTPLPLRIWRTSYRERHVVTAHSEGHRIVVAGTIWIPDLSTDQLSADEHRDGEELTVRLTVASCCRQYGGTAATYAYEGALEGLRPGTYHLRVAHLLVKQYDTPYDSSRVHQTVMLDTIVRVR
jgi:hypothetical protein